VGEEDGRVSEEIQEWMDRNGEDRFRVGIAISGFDIPEDEDLHVAVTGCIGIPCECGRMIEMVGWKSIECECGRRYCVDVLATITMTGQKVRWPDGTTRKQHG
jgi:hypothetical protein